MSNWDAWNMNNCTISCSMRCRILIQQDFYFLTSAFRYLTAECEVSIDNTSELPTESISISLFSVLAKPSKQRKKNGSGRFLWVENKGNLTSWLIQYTERESRGFEYQWEICLNLNCWRSRSWLTCFRLLTLRACLSLLSESLPCYW